MTKMLYKRPSEATAIRCHILVMRNLDTQGSVSSQIGVSACLLAPTGFVDIKNSKARTGIPFWAYFSPETKLLDPRSAQTGCCAIAAVPAMILIDNSCRYNLKRIAQKGVVENALRSLSCRFCLRECCDTKTRKSNNLIFSHQRVGFGRTIQRASEKLCVQCKADSILKYILLQSLSINECRWTLSNWDDVFVGMNHRFVIPTFCFLGAKGHTKCLSPPWCWWWVRNKFSA